MPLGTEVGIGPGDIVLDGYPAPPKRGTAAPQFSTHVYCDQTAGCMMRIPLGTEVGTAQHPPTFRLTLLWHGRPSQQLLSCYQLISDEAQRLKKTLFSFIHSFGLNNTVQDIKVTKTLTYVLGLNTKHQHDIVR